MFYEDTGAKVPSITILRGFLENASKFSPRQTSWRKGRLSTPSGKRKQYQFCNQKIPPGCSALFLQVSDLYKV